MKDDFLDPNASRATVYETPQGLRIIVPTKKHAFITAFMCIWLCGWAFGWVTAAAALVTGGAGGGSLFILFWLCAWTLGGLFAIGIVAWNLFGREEVLVGGEGIRIIRRIAAFQRSTNCKADHISDLRAVDTASTSMFGNRSMPTWYMSGFSHGTIKFDYGSRTLGFGIELERGEGRRIVDLMTERFQYLQKG